MGADPAQELAHACDLVRRVAVDDRLVAPRGVRREVEPVPADRDRLAGRLHLGVVDLPVRALDRERGGRLVPRAEGDVVCPKRLPGVLEERVEQCQIFGAARHCRAIVVRLPPWKVPAQRRIPRARRHDPRRAGSGRSASSAPGTPRAAWRNRSTRTSPSACPRYGAPTTDTAGNIVLRIEGREPGPLRAVLAHKDEIGAMVKRVEDRGRLRVGKLGGSFPWVWGEGPVDVLGRHATVPGVLSFGSRHVSKESAQREQQESAGVRWQDAWVETKLDAAALEAAGIRPGTRLVPTVARKAPVRLGAGRRVRGRLRDRRQGRGRRACSTSPPGCGRRATPPSSSSPPARRSAATARSGMRATPTPRRSWRSR